MALSEMQRNKVDILVQGGMDFTKAVDKVMNDAAVAAAKRAINKPKEDRDNLWTKTKMAIQGKRYKSKKEFKPTGRKG